jgi:CO/xanthine dehydrogenase FAD-binding subunit
VKLLSPRNLDQALPMLTQGPVTPVAGGTDVMVSWHHRPKTDIALMDLSRLSDLPAIRITESDLSLGALTTYWDVMQFQDAARDFPLLADAAKQVGAIQIQTRGTWAGNIGNGSPAADGVPVLMAYDASLVLASVRGQREVPLDQYYTGYRKSVRTTDELIVEIRIPRRPRNFHWFHKVGARKAQAITKVGVAMVHDQTGWRIVANSVAPTVCRCTNLEAALDQNRRFSDPTEVETILKSDISPIDDLRSTAAYRRKVLARLIYFRLAESATS